MASWLTRSTAAAAAAVLSLALAACGSSDNATDADRVPVGTITTVTSEPSPEVTEASEGPSDEATDSGHSHQAGAVKPQPLREGEERMTLSMPTAYTPSAPNGTGTDDYRCFLLDPHLAKDAFLTGTFVQPGNPAVVHHAIPGAWDVATPAQLLAARVEGIDAALRRATGDLLDDPGVGRAAELARTAADACTAAGRPLYAAHAGLPWPEPAHLALWHAVTLLREFRGDGHIACLVDAGLDGIDALVVHAASGEVPRAALQTSRRWDDEAWDASVDRLQARGLVDGTGAFTAAGSALRQHIEDRTDELALGPWRALGEEGCDELRSLVRPLSKAIVGSGTFGVR